MKCKHATRNPCTFLEPHETDRSEENEYEQDTDVERKRQANLSSEIRTRGRG